MENDPAFVNAVCKNRSDFWRMLDRARAVLLSLPLSTVENDCIIGELIAEIEAVLEHQPEEV